MTKLCIVLAFIVFAVPAFGARIDLGVGVTGNGEDVEPWGEATYYDDTGYRSAPGVLMNGNLSLFDSYSYLVKNQIWETLGGSWSGSYHHTGSMTVCYTPAINGHTFDVETQTAYGSAYCVPGPQTTPPPPTLTAYCDDQSNIECHGSPIIVSSTGHYELTSVENGVQFDIDADGRPDFLSWTARGSSTAFLVIDRNNNGVIDSGAELFGNYAKLPNGAPAANGFELLRAFDDNGDRRIDIRDAVWPSVLLWTDLNHDGVSQPMELVPIGTSNIQALVCDYRWTGHQDRYGNLFRWMSVVETSHSKRPLYDVYFRRSD